MDSEMMRALEADGEKLRQLTGEDHGPYYFVPHFVERPVVASQQPAPATNPADAFRNMFAILHNTSLADLNRAQVITDGNPLNNKQWDRFNNDLTTFVLKLDDARLDALWALVQARQPERYKHRHNLKAIAVIQRRLSNAFDAHTISSCGDTRLVAVPVWWCSCGKTYCGAIGGWVSPDRRLES